MAHRVPFLLAGLLLVPAVLLAAACGGGGSAGGAGRLSLALTDAPFPATDGCVAEAIVRIDGVRVRNDEGAFVDLALADGAASLEVDLLKLRAGLTTSLAGTSLPTGAYDEIRLHVVEAVLRFSSGAPERTFKVPSGGSSGLKIKVDPPVLVAAGQDVALTLDVDLGRSFHTTGLGGEPTCAQLEAGEGGVIFRPVVRVLNTSTAGLVGGLVLDATGAPAADVEVCAFPANVVVDADAVAVASTLSTPAGVEGLVEGSWALLLDAGEYDLYVRAQGEETKTLAASAVTVAAGGTSTQDLSLP